MRMSVCRVYVFLTLGALGLIATPSIAAAQYRPSRTGPVVGEDYHIEAAYDFWNAEPSLIVNSEALGILGTDVDLISDLGIEKHRLRAFSVVAKPSKKHRLRFQHLPIKYETDAYPVTREFVFNGQRYRVGLPVTTNVDFTTYSFGYEYDFLYLPRGFFGASVNLKYTNVDVDLQSPIGSEFVTAAAPIPAIGFAGRGYVTPNLAIDAELSFFRIPDSLSEQIEGDGSYTDFDLRGTYNVNKYVGFRLGWRRTRIFYNVDLDTGDLQFKGMYFGGVVRY
jgi:hypothetical protein